MTTQTQSPSITLDYVKTIGIVNNGLNGRGFANPYDMLVDDDGLIYVLNRCDPARASAIRVGICNLDEDARDYCSHPRWKDGMKVSSGSTAAHWWSG